MKRTKYLIQKIKNALNSGTLKEKSVRFLENQVRRYIFIPLRGSVRSTKNLKLNFTDGFKDHRSSQDFLEIQPDQIARIIKAYKLTKLHQKDAAKEFEVKGLWGEWVSVNYKELILGLESENIESLGKLFNNIIREHCTIGLGGYDEWLRYNSVLGKSYIKEVWLDYYQKLIDLQGDQEIKFPKVGNPCGIIYKQEIIPIESLRHAYRAEEIKNCLSDLDEKVVVEIGGGYGGLGFQLMSKLNDSKNTNFLLFDIPEVLAISSAFLLTSFPDKKIRLYGEGSMSSIAKEYEIGVFPHFVIDNLDSDSVDLFYNSCSFSEMDGVSSRKYLSVIERCCRKYFMHDNHDTDFTFRQSDGTFSKNIIGSKLVPNQNLFKLIYKKPRTHGLPEDGSFKSFEFLYERIQNG